MPFISLVLGFAAGLIIINGLPHFVKGITGQKHMTPFGKPSSAIVNVWWGWFNFVVGLVVFGFSRPFMHPGLSFIGFSLGMLVTGLVLGSYWTKHPENNQ